MIAGASQADVGVLIISARKGEFETGFERGGQTREHALLAKTLGVEKLIVAVNKMDDPSVKWARSRYDDIQRKLAPFLRQSGFKDDQVVFLPISGLTGDNLKERRDTPAWYEGKCLIETLDATDIPDMKRDAALRIPMLDGFRDMGHTMAIGKIEQGQVRPGMKVAIQPLGHKATVQTVFVKGQEVTHANVGENIVLRMGGISDDQLSKGFIMCPDKQSVRSVTKFKCQLQVVELAEERPVITAGYKAVLHIHTATEECEISKLNESMSMKEKRKEKNPRFVREGSVVWCVISLQRPTPMDVFAETPQLGRFTLRDEGRTIAIGKVIELPKEGGSAGMACGGKKEGGMDK